MANKDFFLSPDDAQTLGNINYMRKHVKIKHTFPKSLKNPDGFEVVKDISSMEDTSIPNFSEARKESSFSTTSTTPPQSISTSSFKPAPSSTDMDMFRNMARKIGKK